MVLVLENYTMAASSNVAPLPTGPPPSAARVTGGGQYCLCRGPYDGREFMIACDGCEEWFHGRCIGLSSRDANRVQSYLCPPCAKANDIGAAVHPFIEALPYRRGGGKDPAHAVASCGASDQDDDDDDLSSLSTDSMTGMPRRHHHSHASAIARKSTRKGLPPVPTPPFGGGGKVSGKKTLFQHMVTGEATSSETDDPDDSDDDEEEERPRFHTPSITSQDGIQALHWNGATAQHPNRSVCDPSSGGSDSDVLSDEVDDVDGDIHLSRPYHVSGGGGKGRGRIVRADGDDDGILSDGKGRAAMAATEAAIALKMPRAAPIVPDGSSSMNRPRRTSATRRQQQLHLQQQRQQQQQQQQQQQHYQQQQQRPSAAATASTGRTRRTSSSARRQRQAMLPDQPTTSSSVAQERGNNSGATLPKRNKPPSKPARPRSGIKPPPQDRVSQEVPNQDELISEREFQTMMKMRPRRPRAGPSKGAAIQSSLLPSLSDDGKSDDDDRTSILDVDGIEFGGASPRKDASKPSRPISEEDEDSENDLDVVELVASSSDSDGDTSEALPAALRQALGLGDDGPAGDDDICPVCDSECTCRSAPPAPPPTPTMRPPPQQIRSGSTANAKPRVAKPDPIQGSKKAAARVNARTRRQSATQRSAVRTHDKAGRKLTSADGPMRQSAIPPLAKLTSNGSNAGRRSEVSLNVNVTILAQNDTTESEAESDDIGGQGSDEDGSRRPTLERIPAIKVDPYLSVASDSSDLSGSSSDSDSERRRRRRRARRRVVSSSNVRAASRSPTRGSGQSIRRESKRRSADGDAHDSDATEDEMVPLDMSRVCNALGVDDSRAVVYTEYNYSDEEGGDCGAPGAEIPSSDPESGDMPVDVEWSSDDDEEVPVFEIVPASPEDRPVDSAYPSFVQGVMASSPLVVNPGMPMNHQSNRPTLGTSNLANRSRKISLQDFGIGVITPSKRLREELLSSSITGQELLTVGATVTEGALPFRPPKRVRKVSNNSQAALTQIAKFLATSPYTFQRPDGASGNPTGSTPTPMGQNSGPHLNVQSSHPPPSTLALDQVVEADLFATSSESGSETESEDSEAEATLRIVSRFDKIPIGMYRRARRVSSHASVAAAHPERALKGHASPSALSLTLMPQHEAGARGSATGGSNNMSSGNVNVPGLGISLAPPATTNGIGSVSADHCGRSGTKHMRQRRASAFSASRSGRGNGHSVAKSGGNGSLMAGNGMHRGSDCNHLSTSSPSPLLADLADSFLVSAPNGHVAAAASTAAANMVEVDDLELSLFSGTSFAVPVHGPGHGNLSSISERSLRLHNHTPAAPFSSFASSSAPAIAGLSAAECASGIERRSQMAAVPNLSTVDSAWTASEDEDTPVAVAH